MSPDKFYIGQIVQIKRWEDMENEFGLKSNGFINCDAVFIDDMKHLCGKQAKITEKNDKRIKLKFLSNVHNTSWQYSTDMVWPCYPIEEIN